MVIQSQSFLRTLLVFFLFASFSKANEEIQIILDQLPTEHPGREHYVFDYTHERVVTNGRRIELYLPKGNTAMGIHTALVFGHGQAINQEGYQQTFIHLAQKGIPVIFPQYDTGFMDQNWIRMGEDFNQLTQKAVDYLKSRWSIERLVYSGHSKGGYVALTAATLKSMIPVYSIVLFQPAGMVKEKIKLLDPQIPLTIFTSENDRVIKTDIPESIYAEAPSRFKQWIQIRNYPERFKLKADHFLPLSKSYIFGGHNGVSLYHQLGIWKWLFGAVEDVEMGNRKNNVYLYGDDILSTGVQNFQHIKMKSTF